MAKNFNELREKVRSDPKRAARVKEYKREMDELVMLADLRKLRGVTQEQIAAALEVSQSNVSQLERSPNLKMETLDRYVHALGGHLEIAAVFADGQVVTLGSRETAVRDLEPA